MSTLNDFKERVLNDKEFIKKFENIEEKKDMLKIAKDNGYNFTEKEINSRELEETLEQIAGGVDTHHKGEYTMVTGDGALIFESGETGLTTEDWLSSRFLGGQSFDEWIETQL